MNMILFEFSNIEKRYGKSYLLSIPYLQIHSNMTYLLIGDNGSGKTTFIKLLFSLIFPTKGEILKKDKKIAYIPDKIYLPNHLNAIQFLSILLKIRRNLDINEEKTLFLLQKWELNKDKKIGQYSKGMKQKLLIIQALMQKANIYIFDEPLNGLDQDSIYKLILEIKKLQKENKCILIITHKHDIFNNIYNRKLIFHNGIISEEFN